MHRNYYILISFFLTFGLHDLPAQVFDMVIAADGSGDYRTLGTAIGRMPSNSTERILVFIMNGMYREKVNLNALKTNISLIGESVDGVTISWDDYNGKVAGMSTASSYTFLAEGNDLFLENITIENTAGAVAQAVAIRTTGDRQIFRNCRFTGYQDTYYAHKNRQYNLNCFVQGGIDFIFGDATAVFDSCTLNCVSGGQYITAPADTKLTSVLPGGDTFLHGLLFRDCHVLAGDGVGDDSYYLGRPWQPNASSVYISCTLGDHIRPEGWIAWNGEDNHLSSFFAEYRSLDEEGMLVDTLSRVDWSYQLKEDMVNQYYNLDYFLMKDSVWDPLYNIQPPAAPEDLISDEYSLSWSEVTGATGYVISRNDSTVGFSESGTYLDTKAAGTIDNSYFVRSVSPIGALSTPSNVVLVEQTISSLKMIERTPLTIHLDGTLLILSERADLAVYAASGALIFSVKNKKEVPLQAIPKGILLVRAETRDGIVFTKKIFYQ